MGDSLSAEDDLGTEDNLHHKGAAEVSVSHEDSLSAEDDIKNIHNLGAEDNLNFIRAAEVSDDSLQDNSNNLVKHLDQIHKSEDNKESFIEVKSSTTKILQCGVCFKNLCSKNSLKVHVSTVHEKRKDFCCSKCPKTFSTNSHARKHLRNIH